ncbi:uncharacterized protein LTR77_000735 [Saxophila tyrrhenica]|uniref:Uncharacterized protein n=1 Tax=Saxophila tyrrhenica TaxID=1690608 RepID=A0AAV9PPD5_9PEZI|nr:hypothetical protein LTR77_000735 [Saxophila tyrrhenica]
MLSLISESYYSSASDPRDKVYALLGTLGQKESTAIADDVRYTMDVHVDYKSSVSKIYSAIILLIMNERQNFTLLAEFKEPAIGIGREASDITDELPSFVPDLRRIDGQSDSSIAFQDGSPWWRMKPPRYEKIGCLPPSRWSYQAGRTLKMGAVRMANVNAVLSVTRGTEWIPALFSATFALHADCTFHPALLDCLKRAASPNSGDEFMILDGRKERPLHLDTTDDSDKSSSTLITRESPFKQEASQLFDSDLLPSWLCEEIEWRVPKSTRSGDVLVACGPGMLLVLRPRLTGGWYFVGACEVVFVGTPETQQKYAFGERSAEHGFLGLTPLLTDLYTYVRDDEIEEFEIF